jgi:hypothetical protein
MRNQKRKLYPDLFSAFRKFLDICEEKKDYDLMKKTYLYVHTSYPDFGWNIPLLLKEFGISHKVFFTYICKTCGRHFAAIFQDARTTCPYCHNVSATMPSVVHGLSYENMGKMMNCFDAYIQYAICEGCGMCQPEAAACGVPVMAVNYSGMEDIIKKTHGTPLKVERFFRELETGAYRAYPDNKYTAEQIYKFFKLSKEDRQYKKDLAREGAEKHYNWDNIAKTWENYFDNTEPKGLQGKWDASAQFKRPAPLTPEIRQYDNMKFVNWLINDVLHEPEKLHSFYSMCILRDLNYGAEIVGGRPTKLTPDDLYNRCVAKVNEHNYWEEVRCGLKPLIKEDFLEYAEKHR